MGVPGILVNEHRANNNYPVFIIPIIIVITIRLSQIRQMIRNIKLYRLLEHCSKHSLGLPELVMKIKKYVGVNNNNNRTNFQLH